MRNKLIWLLVFVLGLFIVTPAEAKVIIKDKGQIVIPAEEIINDDLFAAGASVDIAGTVNGDIYLGAGTVNFTGKVSGDLVIGAGTVNLDRAAIGDSLIIGAGTVTIDSQSQINGSMLIGAGNLDNQAAVGRNFFAGAGNLKHNAPIGREARFGAGNLMLGPKTMISGDLSYAAEELEQDEKAVIRGQVFRRELPEGRRTRPERNFRSSRGWLAGWLGMEALSFFGALLVGLVMLKWLKQPLQAVSAKLTARFWPSVGWGLVLVFVAPPVLLFLALTGIGAPLAMLLGLVLMMAGYLAKIFVALALGKALAKRFNWQLSLTWVYIAGLGLYYLLRLMPVAGFFVRGLALLAGLGSLWLVKKQLCPARPH